MRCRLLESLDPHRQVVELDAFPPEPQQRRGRRDLRAGRRTVVHHHLHERVHGNRGVPLREGDGLAEGFPAGLAVGTREGRLLEPSIQGSLTDPSRCGRPSDGLLVEQGDDRPLLLRRKVAIGFDGFLGQLVLLRARVRGLGKSLEERDA